MPRKLPVLPKEGQLPFHDPGFSYGDFEGFFVDFLRLSPSINISRDCQALQGRITNAWRYETSGDSQNGIDLRAEVQVAQPDGSIREETWAFQCKHRSKWTDKQIRDAIQLANEKFPADFHFLLVTCDLGARAVNEGRSHPSWQVWSRRDITSHVRALKNRDEAARLVNTYFGPHWAEEILDLPGGSPLQSVGAFFARQMAFDCFHHHRAELVGRKVELDSLQEFLKSSEQRVLILPGAGGAGKSRLLRAFAQMLTPAQRRKWSIRFYEDIGTPVTEKDIAALEGNPVIVIDDAHRQIIEPLLRLTLRSKSAKVVLSTRPQGVALLRSAAAGVGVDARCIRELSVLKKLAASDIKRLAESLLGAGHQAMAADVVAQAHGCLLIVTVACEMIRRKQLTRRHLASHQDFEQAVFVRLVDEGIARLGLIADRAHIDRMLDFVALMGPVPREGAWFDLMCEWTAHDTKPHQLRTWMGELKRCGLLIERKEGYRITPDLLSDHLLFKATFDLDHRDNGFVADMLAIMPETVKDEALARCLPNLAEAEWRARCESEGKQQSVIQPLLQRWFEQFRSSSFHRRREMLGHWSRFGVYLPEQTLQITALARELITPGAPNERGMFGASRDDYPEVLDAMTPLLKEVARYHPEQMHACFDVLWEIGLDQPKRWMHNNQDHPLSAIIGVAQLEYRKPVSINQRALDWIETTLGKPETLQKLQGPVWWFAAMLEPFFKHYVEDEEFDGEVFSIQHVAVDAKRVASLRSRVLEFVSRLAENASEAIILNAVKVLGEGIRMISIPGLRDDDRLQRDWLPQRQEALKKLESLAMNNDSGFVAWSIWQELWWHICYEPAHLLRADCWRVFELLADTFELRLVRAVCSTGQSEITLLHKPEKPIKGEERSWEKSEELWGNLCKRVAGELAQRYPDAASLHDFLADFVQHGASLGFHPGLGTVLFPLTKVAYSLAEGLAHEMMRSSREETKHAFGNLVDGLCPQGKEVRLDLIALAAKSPNETLQIEASRVLICWQKQQRLPNSGESLLFDLVKNGGTPLVRSVLRDASHLPRQHDAFAQKLLACVLENTTQDDITEPLLAMLDRMEQKNSAAFPSELVTSLLQRLVPIAQIRGVMEQHYMAHLAETHPQEVFAFYRQRVAHSCERPKFDLFDSHSYEAIPGHGEHISLRHFAAQPEFEIEFTKIRDELITEMHRRNSGGNQARVYEHGGYHWQLRQLARWMLDDAGEHFASLASAWIPLIHQIGDLWLFLDVIIGESPRLVLKHPCILKQLFQMTESRLPKHLEKAYEDLMFSASRWVGASGRPRWRKRGDNTVSEEKEPWHIIPQVEKLIQDHIHEPMLKAFYEQLLVKCQAMLSYHSRLDDRDDEDAN